ncbi:MAG: anti-sigma factor [Planctomycetota bacterium]
MNERELQRENELIAGWVLGDLTADERESAVSLLSEASNRELLTQLEGTAAAAQIAMRSTTGPSMPQELVDTIREDGIDLVLRQSLDAMDTAIAAGSGESGKPREIHRTDSIGSQPEGGNRREWTAWVVAIAASLLAVVMWRSGGDPPKVEELASLTDLRQALLEQPGTTRVAWGAGKTEVPDQIGGDVVWNSDSQTGYMTFSGLPVNDPTVEQYQLWIIDPERDDEPIDGGVFDISGGGESIVAIDAKLDVIKPAAFAITIEKPGGVVVSTQERLPLLAAVQ